MAVLVVESVPERGPTEEEREREDEEVVVGA